MIEQAGVRPVLNQNMKFGSLEYFYFRQALTWILLIVVPKIFVSRAPVAQLDRASAF